METCSEIGEGELARVEVDAQRELDGVREARQEDRRGDPGGVRDRVRVRGGPAAHGLGGEGPTRDVARGHHEREAEGDLAVLARKPTGELEIDRDGLPWGEVADCDREDVLPVLFGQRGPVPGAE